MNTSRNRSSGMFRSGWIVAVLIVVLLLAPACSVSGEGSSRGAEQHLRFAGSTFGIPTLDPALVRDADTAFLSRQIFRGLMRLDHDLEAVPDLAETVDMLDDGLRFRFRLHDGLTFHDGTTLDAEAVVRSFNRAADPQLAGGRGADLPAATYFSDIVGVDERLAGGASRISGIEVVDARTVDIRLKRPVATFPLNMSGLPAAVVDVASISGENWWHRANGSGPFKVAQYTAGSRLELAAFDDYAGGPPELERVTVYLGQDAQQPLNQYESGEIDVANAPGWALDRFQAANDPFHAHLIEVAQMSTTYLAFNPTIPPFDRPDVRRLIAAGFDIERFISLGMQDRVVRATGMIPPGVSGRTWDVEPIEYDVEHAKQLLDGLPDDLPDALIVDPGGGIASMMAEILERDVGFELVVLSQAWPEFAARLPDRSLPAFILTWIADYPDPENTLASLLRSESADNYLGYGNAEFDGLVDAALVEQDEEARADLYLAAQQIVIDDAIVIPLYHGMSYTLVQPWVHGLEVTEIGILGLEHVWIESESS